MPKASANSENTTLKTSSAKATVPSKSSQSGADQKVRTFVLDTSVLLSDPRAMFRFAEHEVVIPIIVINELELSLIHI